MLACSHKKQVCLEHEGGFDCSPFCSFCFGEQEWCVMGCDSVG